MIIIEDIVGYEKLNPHDLEIAKRYLDVLNHAADPNSDLYVNAEFTSHGITMCSNSEETIGGILVSGLNPGFNPRFDKGGIYFFDETMRDAKLYNRSEFWRNKQKQFFDLDYTLLPKTAYIDLFPYAQSNQNQFMTDINQNVLFQVKTLEITLDLIEYLRPKLIIESNTATSYFWGTSEWTWLGYNLQKLEKEKMPQCVKDTKLRLYRISGNTGFKDSNDRIGQDKYLHKSNLLGSFFVDYGQYLEKHEKNCKDYMLTPKLLKSLYQEILSI